jgi:cytochrome c oxidase assembly protein subunit 15
MTMVERKISIWLLVCSAMVLIMIGLGGYTRLSGAGLSIVDWKPLVGFIPPLSEGTWNELFDQYKAFPEFQKVNSTMALAEFKFIYLIEYFHRLWGRAMGLVLLIPTVYALAYHRQVLPKILFIWLLAGLQGFMGWYMVKSGLVDDPQVSPFRLTMHLVLAIAILCLLLRTVFSMTSTSQENKDFLLKGPFLTLASVLGITICFGGLTAGTHAGLIYNTFPDMNGHFIPEEIFSLQPFWKDLFYNPATIQFCHRILAFVSLTLGVYVLLLARDAPVSPKLKHVCYMIATALCVQVLLVVTTLVLQVPIGLGVVHQVWAAVTFSAIFWGYLLCLKSAVTNSVAPSNA